METLVVPCGQMVHFTLRSGMSSVGAITMFDRATGAYCGGGHGYDASELKESFVCADVAYDIRVGAVRREITNDCLRMKRGKTIGTVDAHLKSGCYGKLNEEAIAQYSDVPAIPLGTPERGPAIFLTNALGSFVEIPIEIKYTQKDEPRSPYNAGYVLRDNRLIEFCRGLAAGMSGTPIIQSGRLVGVHQATQKNQHGVFSLGYSFAPGSIWEARLSVYWGANS